MQSRAAMPSTLVTFVAPPSEDRQRAAVRATTEFFLRQAQLLSELAGGDLLLGLLFLAITDANTRHLAERPDGRYQSIDDIPADDLRRPISVMALAQSLGLPYETTRRYVGRLIEGGLCERVARGLIVPERALQQERTKTTTQRSFQDVRRFVASLRRAGVDVDAMR